jgi:DNA-binding winged helix-turn-helix (wHTH) protein
MVQEKVQINAQRLTSVWNVCGPPSGDFTVGWSQVWRGAWRRNSARLPADYNFLGVVVPSQNGSIYRFGVFELDLRTAELRKKGVKLKLQEQPCQILLKLLEHPGEMVSREKLRSTLWHEDTFVDFETGLNTAIKRLRETLGDSADNPTFIQTLPRRGYKFIAPVEIPASHDSETGAAAGIQESSRGQDLLKRAGLVAVVAVLLLIGWAVWYRQPRPPTVTNAVRLSDDRKAKSPLNSPVTDGVHLYFIEDAVDNRLRDRTDVGYRWRDDMDYDDSQGSLGDLCDLPRSLGVGWSRMVWLLVRIWRPNSGCSRYQQERLTALAISTRRLRVGHRMEHTSCTHMGGQF